MQTIGQLLKQARKKKRKTLNQIALETKIPKTTLEALEDDNFANLPDPPFVKGFVRNFAQAVGMDPNKAIAIFRRDTEASQSREIIPKGLVEPLSEPSSFKKKILAGVIVLIIVGMFMGYTGWQLRLFLSPPEVSIIQPKPEAILKGPIVEVKGWVSADSSVWVNDQLAEIFPNGEFRANITLLPGENTIDIKAENRRGRVSEKRLTVEVVDQ